MDQRHHFTAHQHANQIETHSHADDAPEVYYDSEKQVFDPSDKQVAYAKGKLLAPGGRDDKQTARDYDVDKETTKPEGVHPPPTYWRRYKRRLVAAGVVLICAFISLIVALVVELRSKHID